MKNRKNKYKIKSKYLNKLNIKIYTDFTIPYIKWEELKNALIKHDIDSDKFFEYFGCQTCSGEGPYFYDIEAVFVRMFDKKLVGTQKFWD